MTYIVKAGDTLSGIALEFDVSIEQLQSWNSIPDPNKITVGQQILIYTDKNDQEKNKIVYKVMPGDTLGEIATQFGVSIQQLQEWNNIEDPNLIYIGQKIQINSTTDSKQNQKLTKDQLYKIGWTLITEAEVQELCDCLKIYEINTITSIRHFISQCSHESSCGKWREEIASGVAYEGRPDLGNIYPGDGPKYKGAGYIQLTGRNNYTGFSQSVLDPDILNKGASYVAAYYPWKSAGFWWQANGMNELCRSNPSVEQVTLKVNGGYNGLDSRKYYYQKCCEVI
ncbi:LysM peptidoglycan-binding domain-containing protein [Enterococcus hirae]|nr:LysM peptidoglycan-binding domain-containing protein [Enterococcus hirae]